ncbi:UDP-glucosyltransferase 2 [Bicyclus anynana]|uniref:UDP-glucosyltransferase 2 n=1 Tax=Bicyclus anynana TaxID=110368 RepID=A0A6J1MPU7_BICAN|nr:UDP-glucosyltransferase 2 [Bicyclus anynana]
MIDILLGLEDIQNLIKAAESTNFDLIFVEDCFRATLIFSHIFKSPVIDISSFGGTFETFESVGAVTHPFFYPLAVRQRYDNLSMWEKISEYYMQYQLQRAFNERENNENEVFKKYFGINAPTLDELKKNIHMLFLNIHRIWDSNRPVPSNVVYLGGLHKKPKQDLPEELKSALDSSTNNVIYVSFGTNINSVLLSQKRLETFVEVFSKLPYDIYWKWNDNNLPGLTKNIKIKKWFPQSDLLRHPKVKLFITQGGLQSTDEAIEAGVPLVGIPMIWDQWYNVNKYVQLKIGIKLDINTMTESNLKEAIESVLNDESYKKNILKVRSLMRDQSESPLERAVWWTEYVIRNRGAEHLRAPTANMSWVEYYEVKLILTILLTLILILVSLSFLLYSAAFVRFKCQCKFIYTDKIKMLSKNIICVLILFQLLVISRTAKILAVFPVPVLSHQLVFRELTQELARRGHHVTIVTGIPLYPKGQAPANYTEIDIRPVTDNVRANLLNEDIKSSDDIIAQFEVTFKAVTKIIEGLLELKDVENLIQDKSAHFDVIFVEDCVKASLIFSHIFNAPVIQISSFGGTFKTFEAVGASTHPFLYPLAVRRKYNDLSIQEYISEFYLLYKIAKLFNDAETLETEIVRKRFGKNTPSIHDLQKNIHMLFLNIHPIWDSNRPVPPNVIYLGGLHQKVLKELPEELKSSLDSSINGVIYVSFGTNVDTAILHAEKLQIFADVFSKLPYDIFWKWNDENLPNLSQNIKVMKWFPQSDLLRHPKVKLFITQAGLQSTDEAIAGGIPVIGVPMMWDQWFNADKYVQLKIGLNLDINTLTETKLRDAIEIVLDDKRYKENILKLRSVMQDQSESPLERAVWWTEYVIRNRGAEHLRAPTANMSWVEYYEVKLILAILLALILIMVLLSLLSYFVFKSFIKKVKLD